MQHIEAVAYTNYIIRWECTYVQIQRLLELQSYLHGGISDWPTQMAEPLIKQEAPQLFSHSESVTPAHHQIPAGAAQHSSRSATLLMLMQHDADNKRSSCRHHVLPC